jgi:Flp pilus assembly pilin Flp
MIHFLLKMWFEDDGQDIAEYAVVLAVILVLVVGTIRLVGSSSNTVFSSATIREKQECMAARNRAGRRTI